MLGIDVGSLVDPRQKSSLPILRFLNGIPTRAHGDEGWQILVVGPEPISQPGAKARTDLPWLSAVHEQKRRLVVRNIGVHRADHTELIGMGACGLLKELAGPKSRLTMLLELEDRRIQIPGLAFGPRGLAWELLPLKLGDLRLGIPGVDMGRPTVGENMDQMLGFGRKMRGFGQKRVGRIFASGQRLHQAI